MNGSQEPSRVQLHLVLPYKFEAASEPQVAKLLDAGYRIEQLQRVTDQEVLITLTNVAIG